MRFRDIKKNKNKKQKVEAPKVLYASTPDRIKAFITDMFMLNMPIMYTTAYVVMDGKDAFLNSTPAHIATASLYGVIYAAFLAKTGQTPGKKAYEIKVVDEKSGQNPNFIQSIFRYAMFIVSASSLIGLLTPFFNKEKKTFHDYICKTIVIASPNKNQKIEPLQKI